MPRSSKTKHDSPDRRPRRHRHDSDSDCEDDDTRGRKKQRSAPPPRSVRPKDSIMTTLSMSSDDSDSSDNMSLGIISQQIYLFLQSLQTGLIVYL